MRRLPLLKLRSAISRARNLHKQTSRRSRGIIEIAKLRKKPSDFSAKWRTNFSNPSEFRGFGLCNENGRHASGEIS